MRPSSPRCRQGGKGRARRGAANEEITGGCAVRFGIEKHPPSGLSPSMNRSSGLWATKSGVVSCFPKSCCHIKMPSNNHYIIIQCRIRHCVESGYVGLSQ
jgi:hypothetical protein